MKKDKNSIDKTRIVCYTYTVRRLKGEGKDEKKNKRKVGKINWQNGINVNTKYNTNDWIV